MMLGRFNFLLKSCILWQKKHYTVVTQVNCSVVRERSASTGRVSKVLGHFQLSSGSTAWVWRQDPQLLLAGRTAGGSEDSRRPAGHQERGLCPGCGSCEPQASSAMAPTQRPPPTTGSVLRPGLLPSAVGSTGRGISCPGLAAGKEFKQSSFHGCAKPQGSLYQRRGGGV